MIVRTYTYFMMKSMASASRGTPSKSGAAPSASTWNPAEWRRRNRKQRTSTRSRYICTHVGWEPRPLVREHALHLERLIYLHLHNYYPHLIIISVSVNLCSVDAHPSTIIMHSSPSLFLKQVDRHPPAFGVTPVFMPITPIFPSNFWVFLQYAGL